MILETLIGPLILIIGSFFWYFDVFARAKDYLTGETHMYVIIHGSLFSELSLLNLSRVYNDSLTEDSLYVSMAKRIRKNPYLYQDQTLLEQGWKAFNPKITQQFDPKVYNTADAKKAANFIIPALDQCAREVEGNNIKRYYFTFGHLGLLSQEYRRAAAKELYYHLANTVAYYKRRTRQVRVRIIAHSHGGNLALNLAYHEEQERKKLFIDDLMMLGSPIQVETAPLAFSAVFGRVINGYSEGDVIQSVDRLSTKERVCYKQLFDKSLVIKRAENQSKVYDLRFLVNKNSKRIDHVNMYFIGRSTPACRILDPLPLMVHVPSILALLNAKPDSGLYDCNLFESSDVLQFQLARYQEQEILAESCNLHALTHQCAQRAKDHWKPDDTSRSIMFNRKTGAVLYEALSNFEFQQ